MDPADRRSRLADAGLYLCVGARPDLESLLDAVLPAGVTIVQLREKDGDDDLRRRAGAVMRRAADRHDVLFVVNDDPALAVELGADGVHVGQDDTSPEAARSIVGPDVVIGRSTHAVDEVDRAQDEDCDYFAVGPVSATPTKPGRDGIGLEPIRHAARVGTKPWYVTGGMTPETAGPILDAGARGLVVVRGLTEAADPADVARRMATMIAYRRALDATAG